MTEEPFSRRASLAESPEGERLVSHQVGVFVSFVYQMGDDVPTSAAVSARDSEHSRRRVRLRHHLLSGHAKSRICFIPAISSHFLQTSIIDPESRVQIESISQHSHG